MVEDRDDKDLTKGAAARGESAFLSDARLDALLDGVSAPAARDALRRAILADFDAVRAAAPCRDGSGGAIAGYFDALFGGFAGRAARLASAGALGAVAAAGFSVGVLMNGAGAASEQEVALTYFSAALDETAFYGEGEGDSLWRVE